MEVLSFFQHVFKQRALEPWDREAIFVISRSIEAELRTFQQTIDDCILLVYQWISYAAQCERLDVRVNFCLITAHMTKIHNYIIQQYKI